MLCTETCLIVTDPSWTHCSQCSLHFLTAHCCVAATYSGPQKPNSKLPVVSTATNLSRLLLVFMLLDLLAATVTWLLLETFSSWGFQNNTLSYSPPPRLDYSFSTHLLKFGDLQALFWMFFSISSFFQDDLIHSYDFSYLFGANSVFSTFMFQ